jgi:hypothetical protein
MGPKARFFASLPAPVRLSAKSLRRREMSAALDTVSRQCHATAAGRGSSRVRQAAASLVKTPGQSAPATFCPVQSFPPTSRHPTPRSQRRHNAERPDLSGSQPVASLALARPVSVRHNCCPHHSHHWNLRRTRVVGQSCSPDDFIPHRPAIVVLLARHLHSSRSRETRWSACLVTSVGLPGES